jgi:hypothetical protein
MHLTTPFRLRHRMSLSRSRPAAGTYFLPGPKEIQSSLAKGLCGIGGLFQGIYCRAKWSQHIPSCPLLLFHLGLRETPDLLRIPRILSGKE